MTTDRSVLSLQQAESQKLSVTGCLLFQCPLEHRAVQGTGAAVYWEAEPASGPGIWVEPKI